MKLAKVLKRLVHAWLAESSPDLVGQTCFDGRGFIGTSLTRTVFARGSDDLHMDRRNPSVESASIAGKFVLNLRTGPRCPPSDGPDASHRSERVALATDRRGIPLATVVAGGAADVFSSQILVASEIHHHGPVSRAPDLRDWWMSYLCLQVHPMLSGVSDCRPRRALPARPHYSWVEPLAGRTAADRAQLAEVVAPLD